MDIKLLGIKILHIITRMDMGGSAQNTLLSCIGLSGKFNIKLVYGPSLESNMTAKEKQALDRQVHNAKKQGVKIIFLPYLLRRISPIRDLLCFFFLWKMDGLRRTSNWWSSLALLTDPWDNRSQEGRM